eukprot:Sdes_comp23515_c0_seq1m21737
MSYSNVKPGKLKLKGFSLKKKQKNNPTAEISLENSTQDSQISHLLFGKFWVAKSLQEISGTVLLQTCTGSFLKALNNGMLTLGEPYSDPSVADDTNGPNDAEKLSIVCIHQDKFAIKTAYDRFLSSNKSGVVDAHFEAVGPLETWSIVALEEGNFAFKNNFGKYLGIEMNDEASTGRIKAVSEMIGDSETFVVLSGNTKKPKVEAFLEKREDYGTVLKENDQSKIDIEATEQNLIKRYHAGKINENSLQKKQKIMSKEELTILKKKSAENGDIFEAMLDRRSKFKSDKFCK